VTDARFPRARRLTSTRDFDRVYALKQRVGDDHLLIFAAPNFVPSTRIGLSVSRKHGNSVIRHRIKRLLREAYRLEQHGLPEGLDLVLIPRLGAVSSVDDYRRSLSKLVPRLARRLAERKSEVESQKSEIGDAP
jgi:ribonuclease P protein component